MVAEYRLEGLISAKYRSQCSIIALERNQKYSHCVSNAKIIDHTRYSPDHIGGMFGFSAGNVNIYYCISSPVFSVEKKESCGSFVGGS